MITKEKLEELKNRLLKEKLQILSDVFGEEMALKMFGSEGDVGDIADRANGVYENLLISSISELQRETLDQINEALKRINEGTYGKCIVCGKDIELERLDVIPYADKCIECKKKSTRRF